MASATAGEIGNATGTSATVREIVRSNEKVFSGTRLLELSNGAVWVDTATLLRVGDRVRDESALKEGDGDAGWVRVGA